MVNADFSRLVSERPGDINAFLLDTYKEVLASNPDQAQMLVDIEAFLKGKITPAELKSRHIDNKSLNDQHIFLKIFTDTMEIMVEGDQLSRDNYVHPKAEMKKDFSNPEYRARQKGTLGLKIRELAEKGASYEEVMDYISGIAIRDVITGHPTNVKTLERVASLADLSETLFYAARGDKSAIAENKEKIAEILRTIASQDNPAVNGKLTPQEETKFALHYAKRVDAMLPEIYGEADSVLKEFYAEEYDPLALNLHIEIGSWQSSGDKDGNPNVTGATTMESAIMHVDLAWNEYAEKWNHIKQKYAIESEALDAQLKKPESIKQGARLLFPKVEDIKAELETLYDSGISADSKKEILNFYRSIETFSYSFSDIEYRENSGEIKKVVDGVLGHLNNKKAEETPQMQMRNLLATPNLNPEECYNIVNELCKSDGINKTTLERLKLALVNPELVSNHVIAETGNVQDLLGLEFLKKMVATAARHEGYKADETTLRVIPLFEDPEELLNIGQVMRGMLAFLDSKNIDSKVQGDHLYAMSLLKGALFNNAPDAEEKYQQFLNKRENPNAPFEPKDVMEFMEYLQSTATEKFGREEMRGFILNTLTQVVQIANSDTSRQGGQAGARSAINPAYRELDEISKEFGISIPHYKGGSLLDPSRGGGRAPTALVREAGATGIWQTTQGLDNVAYLNSASGLARNLSRTMHELIRNQEKQNNPKNQGPSAGFAEDVSQILLSVSEHLVTHYREDYYENPVTAELIAAIDYPGVTLDGNDSSRPGARPGDVKKKASLADSRAISISETFKEIEMVTDFLGTRGLNSVFLNRVSAHYEKCQKVDKNHPFVQWRDDHTKQASGQTLVDRLLRDMYLSESNSGFRDMIDRVAFSAVSNFELVTKKVNDTLSHLAEGDDRKQKVSELLQKMEREYRDALKTLYPAMTGRPAPIWAEETPTADIRKTFIEDCIPHYKQYAARYDRCTEFFESIRPEMPKTVEEAEQEDGKKQIYLRRLIHGIMDIAIFFTPTKTRDTVMLARNEPRKNITDRSDLRKRVDDFYGPKAKTGTTGLSEAMKNHAAEHAPGLGA